MRWTDESCTGKGMGVADSGVRNIGMRRLACGAVLALALVAVAGGATVSPRPARAEPWAPVNDIQLKNDITTLKEYGIIPGSVTTWPIPWAAISGALARAQGQAYPPHVMAAIARVRAKMPKRADFRRPKASAEAMGTNRARLVRDFGGGARGDFDSRVAVERHWASAYARLAVNFRDDPVDPHDINLDGSYGAVALGNWMLFGGRVEQWWGPGWDAAMQLSNNARPMAVVGLGRLEPKPFESRWLRWIGPWNLRVFAGRKSRLRNDFAHPWLAGYRVDFAPTSWMSWGLTYMVQFCGKGRPCSFTNIRKALLPFPNQTNTRIDRLNRDPGDAQSGWDVTFHGTIGDLAWSAYTQQVWEDQAEDTGALYGISLTGRTEWLGGGQWRIMGESADTVVDRSTFIHKTSKGGLLFQNSIFRDGSTYRRRVLGPSLDFNSLQVTGRLMLQLDKGPSFELIYRYAGINRPDPEQGGLFRAHLVSANHEKINMLETRVIWPTERFGRFRLEAGIADDAPNTPGRSPTKGRIEIGWSYGF
ncbi:MAG: outer membrane protein in capsule/EPS biosynthesis locus [Rhodothalassiaceae bacterium]|nr:MAG: outer membrane protein in capsule/EPS biosynthesis locus [Rhodothalassiaceae bacterium]